MRGGRIGTAIDTIRWLLLLLSLLIGPLGVPVSHAQAGPDAAEEERIGPADVPLPDLPDPSSRAAIPPFELKDMSGRAITLESLQDQVVLIVFWATWCPPCKLEIPHLIHLQQVYGESGFRIIALSLDQNGLKDVRPFVQGRPEINYTIVPSGFRAQDAFGRISNVPTNFLLDKDGRLVRKTVGFPRKEREQEKLLLETEGYIQALLMEG